MKIPKRLSSVVICKHAGKILIPGLGKIYGVRILHHLYYQYG
ncbi:MAG: hypothetical protein Q8788_02435 [Candidatus Phytoplasma australasiaticum]|nr:hypothetical protein [Candidatus Phytoplasma australasiaticum]